MIAMENCLRPLSFFAVIAMGLASLSGCDTMGTKSSNLSVNPYTDITDTYSEAAKSAMKYAQARPSESPIQVKKRMAQGYRHWIEENKSNARSAFGDFAELQEVQHSIQRQIATSPSVRSKSVESLPLDSLLSAADLSSAQKDRIETLLDLPKKIDSLSEVESKLNKFDRETAQVLNQEDRKVVLQMSAILRAQAIHLANLSPSKVATLFDQTDASDASYAKDDDDDDGRPEWADYFSEEDILESAAGLGLSGLSVGGNCGVVVHICGPAFAAGGAVAGAAWEYSSQFDRYQRDLQNWCAQGGNSHSTCQEHLP